MNEFSRGPEWRRWDLHIHTPGTKKNDNFSGSSLDDKWEKFYTAISSYVGNGEDDIKNISVIGITDYLSIENYIKVKNDNKLPRCIKLLLPNIEMRFLPIARNSPINIHFIFNPSFVDQIETRFFSKIKCRYADNEYTALKADLIRLGKDNNSERGDEECYKKGIEQFVPSFDAIQEVFKADSELRKNVIIGVSNSSCDGVSGAVDHSSYLTTEGSQLQTLREAIYRFVDIIFSASDNDIKYFLGKKENCPPDLVKRQCNSLKPCIIGCDAHSIDKIFEPDNKKYCWIKADPTFEGLKQIIYEPEDRVRISDIKPETKSDYYVIDRVEFNDPSFQEAPVYFNDKLNCIIGGKSTGKSILIQNLARSISPAEAEKTLKKAQNKTLSVDTFKTYWKDGSTSDDRKIIYIPQTYLNKLTDNQAEKTEIDFWIQDVLFQNSQIKKAYENYEESIKELKIKISKNIIDLISCYNEHKKIIGARLNIGDIDGVQTQISKLNKEKEEISSSLNISNDDIKQYNEALEKINIISNEIKDLKSDKTLIEHTTDLLFPADLKNISLTKKKEKLLSIQQKIQREANESWNKEKEQILTEIETEISQKEEDLTVFQSILYQKKPLIESNNAIKVLSENILQENIKLNQLNELNKQLEEIEKNKDNIIDMLSNSPERFKEINEAYKNVINSFTTSDDSLSFFANVQFREEVFREKIQSIYNNKNKHFKSDINVENFSTEKYTKDFLSNLIKNTLNETFVLKSEYTPESALREMLENWYNTNYKIKMDEDTIDKMSPGKKALVLLKILIALAEARCPILIDQPEDDLDNRSIYDELVKFIKEKKKERQIIIVTHNANIVLGADAEEVIIANQDGQKTKNKDRKFEYRSGSLENCDPIKNSAGEIEKGILNSQGIQNHICDILEGGKQAFSERRNKYRI